jgi:outer membrane protein TolC
MTRWNARLAAVAMLMAGLAGCRQQCFMTEADFLQSQNSVSLSPPGLEYDPHASITPGPANEPAPTTVNDLNRPIRYISLPECIAIALEQGNIGSQSSVFPGIINDTLVAFNGRLVAGDDSIRVLALEPAILAADIESSLARFDARWISSATWTKTDDAIANGLQSFQNGDQAQVQTGIYKPLPTGGVAGITLSTQYTFLTTPPQNFAGVQIVNPSYRPRAQVLFEQPLLQNFGVEINQITTTVPNSSLVPGGLRPSGGTRTEGILISRIRFDQQRAEFERNVNFMLLNVEFAYWNLYGSYFTLYSREQGLRQALVSWQVNRTRFDAGQIPIQDLEQTRAQYELFRAQRFTALGRVLENERQLRGLLGMRVEDGSRLVPADAPTLAPVKPDWAASLQETLGRRPELILARQDLKFRQLDLIGQKNFLKPDLRFFATYDVNGLGTRLDGSEQDPNGKLGNALASLTNNVFNSYTVGLRMDIAIGNRDAYAAVRTARLNLSRSYWQLQDQERKAGALLAQQYRNLEQYYGEIEAQRAQRLANAKQLEARFNLFKAGSARGTIDVLLEAQRNLADALASEYQAIVNYNNSIAAFQFAKGTILDFNNVRIAEGPVPGPVQVRAVEQTRQRTEASLILRERPDPAVYTASVAPVCLSDASPPSLATVPVMETTPAAPMPEPVPATPMPSTPIQGVPRPALGSPPANLPQGR